MMSNRRTRRRGRHRPKRPCHLRRDRVEQERPEGPEFHADDDLRHHAWRCVDRQADQRPPRGRRTIPGRLSLVMCMSMRVTASALLSPIACFTGRHSARITSRGRSATSHAIRTGRPRTSQASDRFGRALPELVRPIGGSHEHCASRWDRERVPIVRMQARVDGIFGKARVRGIRDDRRLLELAARVAHVLRVVGVAPRSRGDSRGSSPTPGAAARSGPGTA